MAAPRRPAHARPRCAPWLCTSRRPCILTCNFMQALSAHKACQHYCAREGQMPYQSWLQRGPCISPCNFMQALHGRKACHHFWCISMANATPARQQLLACMVKGVERELSACRDVQDPDSERHPAGPAGDAAAGRALQAHAPGALLQGRGGAAAVPGRLRLLRPQGALLINMCPDHPSTLRAEGPRYQSENHIVLCRCKRPLYVCDVHAEWSTFRSNIRKLQLCPKVRGMS